MNTRDELETLLDTLATQRDELIVRAHLAGLEAREEWQELEAKLDDLRGKAGRVARTADDVTEDVAAAVRLLGEEIRNGYERLRRLF